MHESEQDLVGCCGHNITVVKRIGNHRSSNKPTYVSHIHHKKRTSSIRNLPMQIRYNSSAFYLVSNIVYQLPKKIRALTVNFILFTVN